MKKVLKMLLLSLILLLPLSNVYAMELVTDKEQVVEKKLPQLAVLYVNNAKTKYDDAIDEKIMQNIDEILKNRYEKISGEKYIADLNKKGITDISMAERADIMDSFKNESMDYVMYVSIEPLIVRDKMTFFTVGKDVTVVMALKIIDLKNNRYVYNGKFTEKASDSTAIGGIGNKSVTLKGIDKINKSIKEVFLARM